MENRQPRHQWSAALFMRPEELLGFRNILFGVFMWNLESVSVKNTETSPVITEVNEERKNFVTCVLVQMERNPQWLLKIMWTDEAYFF